MFSYKFVPSGFAESSSDRGSEANNNSIPSLHSPPSHPHNNNNSMDSPPSHTGPQQQQQPLSGGRRRNPSVSFQELPQSSQQQQQQQKQAPLMMMQDVAEVEEEDDDEEALDRLAPPSNSVTPFVSAINMRGKQQRQHNKQQQQLAAAAGGGTANFEEEIGETIESGSDDDDDSIDSRDGEGAAAAAEPEEEEAKEVHSPTTTTRMTRQRFGAAPPPPTTTPQDPQYLQAVRYIRQLSSPALKEQCFSTEWASAGTKTEKEVLLECIMDPSFWADVKALAASEEEAANMGGGGMGGNGAAADGDEDDDVDTEARLGQIFKCFVSRGAPGNTTSDSSNQKTGGAELSASGSSSSSSQTLGATELHQILMYMGITATSTEVQSLVQEHDSDGDGQIREEEFVLLMKKAQAGKLQVIAAPLTKQSIRRASFRVTQQQRPHMML